RLPSRRAGQNDRRARRHHPHPAAPHPQTLTANTQGGLNHGQKTCDRHHVLRPAQNAGIHPRPVRQHPHQRHDRHDQRPRPGADEPLSLRDGLHAHAGPGRRDHPEHPQRQDPVHRPQHPQRAAVPGGERDDDHHPRRRRRPAPVYGDDDQRHGLLPRLPGHRPGQQGRRQRQGRDLHRRGGRARSEEHTSELLSPSALHDAPPNLYTGRNSPNGRHYLLVSGMMTITPDAGDALRQYMGMMINGMVYCPDSLATVLASKAAVNGKVETYPDGAVVLRSNAVLDRAFALRAEPGRLYWAAKRLIAVDSALDGEELAARGVRFAAREAYLAESLAESLAPLFDPDTQLTILPDGVTVEQDDLTLNGTALRRLGDSLVVLGDLRLTEDCAEALSNLGYLQVEGDIYLPESLPGALGAV